MTLLWPVEWTCRVCEKVYKTHNVPSFNVKVGKKIYRIPICNKCINIARGGIIIEVDKSDTW